MEHYRPNGQLSRGYFCYRCGEPTSMIRGSDHGEGVCEVNIVLVKKLQNANPSTGKNPIFEDQDLDSDTQNLCVIHKISFPLGTRCPECVEEDTKPKEDPYASDFDKFRAATREFLKDISGTEEELEERWMELVEIYMDLNIHKTELFRAGLIMQAVSTRIIRETGYVF